jgi:hypothetical protein
MMDGFLQNHPAHALLWSGEAIVEFLGVKQFPISQRSQLTSSPRSKRRVPFAELRRHC